MARPHIEFIRSGRLRWTDAAPLPFGDSCRILSRDDQTGAVSALVRLEPGWRLTGLTLTGTCEFLVLDGAFTFAGRRFGRHCYGWYPAGATIAGGDSEDGALLLMFAGDSFTALDGSPDRDASPDRDIVFVDCFERGWDMMNMDPGVAYLNMGRKNLRVPKDGSGRTYLLAGFPQARPAAPEQKLERHPYAEEGFMIAGDLAMTCGVMTADSYFWRPPNIWHGGMYSVTGFMMLIRTPGANDPIIEWSETTTPLLEDPPYRPVLPEQLKAAL